MERESTFTVEITTEAEGYYFEILKLLDLLTRKRRLFL